jgi:SPP1 family phage portal protein
MVAREEKGWGVIPFIPLKLNSEMKSQLTVSLKSLIDAYDLLFSAFADTIEAVQDALLLVKDRSAETYEDLLFKIKRFKILKVDDTGDAKFLSIDFPYSAREKALTMIRENIYSFSKSVDLELMSRGGGQLTTAYIETLFFKLDEKGNKFIKQIDKFLIDFFSFVNIYKTQIKSMQPDDLTKVKFLYDKTRPSNMAEAVSTVNSCKGIISDRTLLSQHPLVTDVDEEIALIEADEQQYLENTTGSGLDATNGDTGDI